MKQTSQYQINTTQKIYGRQKPEIILAQKLAADGWLEFNGNVSTKMPYRALQKFMSVKDLYFT